jgi:hemin uptake protein HemP
MSAPVDQRAPATGDECREPACREVRSEELFGNARIVLIRHADTVYTLRRTSNGKLILTK